MKEHELDPIRRFMGGPHKKLYDEINLFIQTQEPNFAYIEDNQAQQIQDILTDSDCYKDNHMQQAKTLTDAVNEKINTLLQQEKQSAAKSANAMCDRLMSMDEYAQLSAEHQNQLKQAFEDLIQKSQSQTLIAVISDTLRRFEEHDYQQLLAKMCEWAKPPVSQADAMDTEKGQTVIAEPKVEYTTLRSLTIAFEKAWLADEADVEHYLLEMKEAMMKEIQAGNRVQV
jgi:protease II